MVEPHNNNGGGSRRGKGGFEGEEGVGEGEMAAAEEGTMVVVAEASESVAASDPENSLLESAPGPMAAGAFAAGVEVDEAAAVDEAAGGDDVEVPIVCGPCLGPNPYVRMARKPFGKECSVCTRPCTVFRWRPAGKGMRTKSTMICPTCAKLKNVCQTCMLDLEFGLPVQVRDSALQEHERQSRQVSDVNRVFALERFEQKLAREGPSASPGFRSYTPAQREMLERLARRRAPRAQERNRARVCYNFVAGRCKRGANCPFRHEVPRHDPALAKQTLKDRYHGVNDPVAARILADEAAGPGAHARHAPPPPADRSLTTLWVGSLPGGATAADVRQAFAAHGDVESVRLAPGKPCAFVTYRRREDAEDAARRGLAGAEVAGKRVRVSWAKSSLRRPAAPPPGMAAGAGTVAGAGAASSSGAASLPPGVSHPNAVAHMSVPRAAAASRGPPPPPPGMSVKGPSYPSMDPKGLGAKLQGS